MSPAIGMRRHCRLRQVAENLIVFGESVDVMFAENHLSIADDVKDSAAAFNES